MSRIIMLIPLDDNVGLNSVSLSMIYCLNKKLCKNNSRKPVLYLSCSNNHQDNISLIINKYFSKFVHILNDIDFSKNIFNSCDYFSLLNKLIEDIYHKKWLYQFILIKGLSNNVNMYSQDINYDIAQNLSAEVIFLSNIKKNYIENFKVKEKEIELIIKRKNYKNVLGVIFNKVNSPFINKKYDFFKKLIILKKIQDNEIKLDDPREMLEATAFKIIACIPWNKDIKKISIINIYNFLEIKFIKFAQMKNSIVEEVLLFDQNYKSMISKNYLHSLIIVSFTRIFSFINMFVLNFNSNEITGIILTEVSISEKDITFLCKKLIEKKIHVAFTKKNTIEIVSQLQKINFDIYLQDQVYIQQSQKYISSFFSYFLKLLDTQYDYRMMYSPREFCCYLKLLSKQNKKRIILPESYEVRILKAVSISHNNIAECVLLGDKNKIYSIAKNNGIDLNKNIEIINPILIRDKYIARFLELRKKKDVNRNFAEIALLDNIVLATLILEANEVDGLVSGSVNTTASTILPALQLIKTNSDTSLVSSIFFMLLPNQVLIYGDCAVNVNPNAEELAEIAIQSSNSLKMFGIEPRIAMLSYSTGFSGNGETVEKVRQATAIIKNKNPNLIVDGPVQYDTAVSKTVFKLKAPRSPIEGSANIFIFPDLNAGNIAYKAVQRTANIVAIGPILQGLRKPVNDLSRGASVEDIIYTIALTSIQSK